MGIVWDALPNKKRQYGGFYLAGAVGIEPTSLVLETRVLPLYEAPTTPPKAGLVFLALNQKSNTLF